MLFLFDIGLPMIIPSMYFMVIALIPIVLLESYYAARNLRIRFSRTVGSFTFGNVVSTLVGIPITWMLLFGIQIVTGGTSAWDTRTVFGKLFAVTVQAPWLMPFSPEEFWMGYAAAMFLLIPFFFATWFIEYVMTRNKLAIEVVEANDAIDLPSAERRVWKAVRNANLLSYGLIALLLVVSFVMTAKRY